MLSVLAFFFLINRCAPTYDRMRLGLSNEKTIRHEIAKSGRFERFSISKKDLFVEITSYFIRKGEKKIFFYIFANLYIATHILY